MTEKNGYAFETAVGYFFTIAVMIVLVFIIFMFFRSKFNFFKARYVAYYEYGNDLKYGTIVTLNGINIGEIKDVDIDDNNRVKVIFSIKEKYTKKIRTDSIAKIVRPLLIGNKQISISPGSETSKILPVGSVIKSEESSELIDLVSGVSLQNFIDRMGLNPESFDLSGDTQKITVRELYDMAISSLITMNEFQKSIKNMGQSINGMNTSFQSMSGGISLMAESMNLMGEAMGQMKDLSGSMTLMGDNMSGLSKNFGSLNNSMLEMSKSMNLLNKDLNKNLAEFGPLTDQVSSFLEQLEVIIAAMETNWMFKKDVERIKKERGKDQKK